MQLELTFPELLKPLRGKDDRFLADHFCSGIAGHRLNLDSIFTEGEQDWIAAELSRRDEARTIYAPGERLTWRSDHLDSVHRADIQNPRLDDLVVKRLIETGMRNATPVWPDGHSFALCITHDVDHVSANNWREAWRPRAAAGPFSSAISGQDYLTIAKRVRFTASSFARKYVFRSTDNLAGIAEWMKIEDEFGFRSTFYFFAAGTAARHPWDCNYSFSDNVPFGGCSVSVRGIMKELARSGWDIGLHPSYFAATSAEWLGRQKQVCEEAIGAEVISVRQHTLQYSVTSTPSFQAAAGLHVDSTHGFNDLVGFRAGTAFPYLCWDWKANTTLPLLELPLHIQDGPLMRGASSTDGAIANALSVMNAVEKVNGCLVILWHPHWLATESGLAVFKVILEEAKRRNAWGCSARQAAQWWLGRTHTIMNGEQANWPGDLIRSGREDANTGAR